MTGASLDAAMAKTLGQAGEDAARRFAEAKGLRLVARNVRTPFGEIDLVLEDKARTLVFAEVKARSGRGFATGEEAVTRKQRDRVRNAGLACAQALGRPDSAMRFDIFAVEAGRAGAPARVVDHIEDAF